MKEKERERLMGMVVFDQKLKKGQALCAGMDEAGRGPLAGPVCAACVVMPDEPLVEGIKDSKKIAEAKRREIAQEIKRRAVAYGIGLASVEEIESLNILGATKLAMQRAWEALGLPQAFLMIDGNFTACTTNSISIIQGDAKSYCVAAASILAKTARDALLIELDRKHPEYGFAQHKGYGTKQHIQAIQKYGPLPEHRKLFIRRFL